ncbi:DENN domain-containing protein 10-like [Saccostrea echinata]|uniref:DENN domain-containing protein 10-like n=1 Tax=Saccostrea echinata TaxID=191078 RepID=UPI002A806D4A|nr:DENN domain-containing protein 10-like [Saccostrea echinata]
MTNTHQFLSAKSTGLIERDVNGDVLWTWSYPSVSEADREFFIRKSRLDAPDNAVPFLYSQRHHTWYYIFTFVVDDSDHLPKVTHVSIVLVTKDFNPEKYEILCRILLKKYRKSGNPAQLLESYLSVTTRGSCSTEENGRFSVQDYDIRRSYANTKLKDFILTYGVESIIVYTALLLKKRLVVYCPENQVQQLMSIVRSLPALVWHRQNWDIAFPLIEMEDSEVDVLKQTSSYVAGVTDASMEGRSDLYDVFVNTSTGQISIAPEAKESFAMGKLHKDIAKHMVQCAESDEMTEEQLIKEISKKTGELLNNLRSLATETKDGKHVIQLETLKERKMAPATESFLFSLAACEGLVDV